MNLSDLLALRNMRLEGVGALVTFSAATWLLAGTFGGAVGLDPVYTVAIGGALQAVVLLGWLFRRHLPRFKDVEIGIAVAVAITGKPGAAGEAQDTLDELVANLRSEALRSVPDNSPLRFRVERLPGHIIVRDHTHADALLDEMNATYLLWGSTAKYGKARGRDAFDLGTLHFCIRHGAMDEQRRPLFIRALEQVQEMRSKYIVYFDNDVEDIKVVGHKIGIITKYHVGMAAATRGLREVAIPLLEACLGDERFRFQRSARRTIVELWTAGWGGPNWPTPRTDRATATRALADARAALKAGPRSESGLVLLVNSLFVLGEIREAARENEALLQVNEAVYRTNRAVFALAAGKFDDALGQYKRLKKLRFTGQPDSSEALRQSASRWLADAQEVVGPAFGFGLAFINDELGDPLLAYREYEAVLPLLDNSPIAKNYVTKRLAALGPAVASPVGL